MTSSRLSPVGRRRSLVAAVVLLLCAPVILAASFALPVAAGRGSHVPHGMAAASASMDTSASALAIASSMAKSAGFVTSASFVSKPMDGAPTARVDGAIAGFPTDGTTFALLTSGDATLADDPNDSGSSGVDAGGANLRGDTDYDVTILRVNVTVPSGNNCIRVDFRFLSDEFPEYVGSPFNDAFIAEIDTSTWATSGSEISAPDNFAFDPDGNVVSINAAGAATMTQSEADGTTYDGATSVLRASTPATPGAHALYFSIFDQADAIYDSAVMLDALFAEEAAAGTCLAGVQPADPLEVSAQPTKPVYSPLESATVLVHAGYARAGPKAGVLLDALVTYTSGNALADSALAQTGCLSWSAQAVTDENGDATLDIPAAIVARCVGGSTLGLVELPTDLGGSYSFRVDAVDGVQTGAASTSWNVSVSELAAS